MANNIDKIDQIKVENQVYDIDLPTNATPVIDSLTVTNEANIAGLAVNNSNIKYKNVDVVTDNNYTHTDNNFTTAYKDKVDEVDNKVAKEPGKGLSANDYTNADKAKLASFNIIEITAPEEGQNITITQEQYDSINENTLIIYKTYKTSPQTITQKSLYRPVFISNYYNWPIIFSQCDINQSPEEIVVSVLNIYSTLQVRHYAIHSESTDYKVSSWSPVPNDIRYPSEKLVKDSLDDKVDKVPGKELSTNDFSNAEKEKLSKINVINANSRITQEQYDNINEYTIVVKHGISYSYLSAGSGSTAGYYYFFAFDGLKFSKLTIRPDLASTVSNSSFEVSSNKVSSWSSTPNDTHYPSEKLVKDSLDTLQTDVNELQTDVGELQISKQNAFQNIIFGTTEITITKPGLYCITTSNPNNNVINTRLCRIINLSETYIFSLYNLATIDFNYESETHKFTLRGGVFVFVDCVALFTED